MPTAGVKLNAESIFVAALVGALVGVAALTIQHLVQNKLRPALLNGK
jgi:ABC-type Fe3+-siderophore transport system permease subunit